MLLIKINEEKKFYEGKDFSGVFFPVGLLEQHVDHNHDELAHVNWSSIEIEAFLDPGEYFWLKFFEHFVFKIGIQERRCFSFF